MAKGAFGPTYDGIKAEKGSIKKNTTSSKKKERATTVHGKYIIYKRPGYKKLKTYYYVFPENIPKGGSFIIYT